MPDERVHGIAISSQTKKQSLLNLEHPQRAQEGNKRSAVAFCDAERAECRIIQTFHALCPCISSQIRDLTHLRSWYTGFRSQWHKASSFNGWRYFRHSFRKATLAKTFFAGALLQVQISRMTFCWAQTVTIITFIFSKKYLSPSMNKLDATYILNTPHKSCRAVNVLSIMSTYGTSPWTNAVV